MRPKHSLRTWLKKLGWLAVFGAAVGFLVWYSLFRTEPVAAERSLEDEFKYGSMGTETEEGTPYWIWIVLPKVFPEYLPGPGGWASLGLPWEEGKELPVGSTKRVIGFERVGVNCSFCHVSQVRLDANRPPKYYPGGPSHQVMIQEYQEFLFKSAADPRFNADTIMHEIDGITTLSERESLLYRHVLIPMTKKALLKQRDEFAWQTKYGRPRLGPGRTDPFNPMRFRVFKEPDDQSVGNSDIPSIWNQKARKGGHIHWDGLSKSLHETAISSAIGDGARGAALNLDYLKKVEEYLWNLQAPKYPLEINQELAAKGAPIYERACASCHTPGREKTGTVIPIAELGTDPHRTMAWTQSQVDDWKRLATEYQHKYNAPWNLDTFNKAMGYVAGPLDGIWLRGPYLHNGSVPSLAALLEKPEQRPISFYRGNDLLDGQGVGFVSNVPEQNGRHFFYYDTSLKGNSNAGHSYGTELSADEKSALVEYMKTL